MLRGGGAAARTGTGGHRDRGDDPARVTPKPAERPRREVPACGAALPRGPIWRDEESSSVRRQGEAALFFLKLMRPELISSHTGEGQGRNLHLTFQNFPSY